MLSFIIGEIVRINFQFINYVTILDFENYNIFILVRIRNGGINDFRRTIRKKESRISCIKSNVGRSITAITVANYINNNLIKSASFTVFNSEGN